MPLITVLTRDPSLREAVRALLGADHDVAGTRSWNRLLSLVRERPVTAVVLDSAAVSDEREPDEAVADLRRRFPSLATIFVQRPRLDPLALFRLGRAGIDSLALVQLDGLSSGLRQAMARCARWSTEAQVVRSVGGRLPAQQTAVVRLALSGVQLGWCANDLAERTGLTRAHLSVRLKSCGLPSVGHLLLWAKLLHSGRWLTDPARSAESISRQLEYSSGAAFRRALHNYVGRTPTAVKQGGGLPVVLRRFLDVCAVGDRLRVNGSVA